MGCGRQRKQLEARYNAGAAIPAGKRYVVIGNAGVMLDNAADREALADHFERPRRAAQPKGDGRGDDDEERRQASRRGGDKRGRRLFA